MFRLIKPSSDQFINHTDGPLSSCAHCGIPNKHLGYHNVHIYWLYLQYGLRIGLMTAQRAETCCQIYRLIIELFVVYKHLGSYNVHIYGLSLRNGLWIGLMMARWAKTCCQIYRLIIELYIVFQLNIIILIWYLYWITQQDGPNQKKSPPGACTPVYKRT